MGVSCHLDFIDEDNVLCRDAWQMESLSTFSSDGKMIGFEDRTANSAFVMFYYTGTWSYESETGTAPEYGLWHSEVVPKKDLLFDVVLISDFQGQFIKEGHSGEVYQFTLSQTGDTLSIQHRHTDDDEYTVTRLKRSSFTGFNKTDISKQN